MKKIWIIILFIISIFTLTGCNNNQNPEKVQLSFRITWDLISGRGDAIQAIVTRFNNQNDDVFVTLVGGNENQEEIELLLESEEPTHLYVLPYRLIQHFGERDMLQEVNNPNQYNDLFFDSIMQMAKVDDVLYGVPWVGHSMALIYNKDILDDASVNPDDITDFESLLVALAAVEENVDVSGIGLVGGNHHDLSWMTTQFIYSFGGTLSDDTNIVSINSEETKQALEYYINDLGSYAQDNWDTHNGGDVMSLFLNQEVAFEIQGPWGITDIWKNGNPFEVGAISLSKIGGYAEVGPLMLSIPTGLDDDTLTYCQRFIDYMISIESLELIMNGEYIPKYESYYPFRVPVRTDMVNSQFFTQYPEFKEFIYGFEQPSINTPSPEWNSIHVEYYQPLLNQVIQGTLTIDEFLSSLEEQNEIIE